MSKVQNVSKLLLIHATQSRSESFIRIRKFTDHGPNTGFYGPDGDQSECMILNIIIDDPEDNG